MKIILNAAKKNEIEEEWKTHSISYWVKVSKYSEEFMKARATIRYTQQNNQNT